MAGHAQRGMVLLISLVFLVVLTLIGLSSMQNATLQEKMTGSLSLRHHSFQSAEAALRLGEARLRTPGHALVACNSSVTCAAPAHALEVTAAGLDPRSGVTWYSVDKGFYALQNLGSSADPINIPAPVADAPPHLWDLYRITGVGIQGHTRTVLESVHADGRRILWRQIQ